MMSRAWRDIFLAPLSVVLLVLGLVTGLFPLFVGGLVCATASGVRGRPQRAELHGRRDAAKEQALSGIYERRALAYQAQREAAERMPETSRRLAAATTPRPATTQECAYHAPLGRPCTCKGRITPHRVVPPMKAAYDANAVRIRQEAEVRQARLRAKVKPPSLTDKRLVEKYEGSAQERFNAQIKREAWKAERRAQIKRAAWKAEVRAQQKRVEEARWKAERRAQIKRAAEAYVAERVWE